MIRRERVWAKSDDHRTRRESKLEAQLAARNTMSLYLLHINSMLAVCTRIINMPRGNGTGELLHAADRVQCWKLNKVKENRLHHVTLVNRHVFRCFIVC